MDNQDHNDPVTTETTARESRLPRFSLDRRITVFMILLTLIVLGTVATLSIPVELLPSGFDGPHLSVQVPWREAPSQEVLDKIVLPLEEELSTVAGIDQLNSYARTGFAMCNIMFKQGTDMDVAYREVRDRVERARIEMAMAEEFDHRVVNDVISDAVAGLLSVVARSEGSQNDHPAD